MIDELLDGHGEKIMLDFEDPPEICLWMKRLMRLKKKLIFHTGLIDVAIFIGRQNRGEPRPPHDCSIREDIMSHNIAETFELLFDKNNNVAYKALQELQKESEETDGVYPYMDRLSDMLDSDNSYIRTRGLTLLAYNAKWDRDYKIDEIIDKYLKHITDVKPITARQCIKLLPMVAKYKPELKNDILSALHKADISVYDSSMQSLVYKDIQKTLKEIQKS